MKLTGFASKNKTSRKANSARAYRWVLAAMLIALAATPLLAGDWTMFGYDTTNTANNGSSINTQNVNQLKVKFAVTTGGDVSARPAVAGGMLYFPDWGGNIWAVNSNNGMLLWTHQLSSYFTGASSGSVHSRTTPAVMGGTIYVATQEGAWLLAINANKGTLLWKTQLEAADGYAIISTSPAISGNTLYTGVASTAEGGTFFGVNLSASVARGSVVAVDAAKGTVKWKFYTVPAGYIGGGVWGSSPVVDAGRKTVYIGTGDNYSHPHDTAPSSIAGVTYAQCIGSDTEANCLSPDDHVDSILALDMNTGALKWAKKKVTWNQSAFGVTDGSDDWNVDCSFGLPQCPTMAGPDYDFGSAPNEITYKDSKGKNHTIIGAGQKSGIYYALDPDTGAELWEKQVGPGSSLGGMEWGSASDGQRIYVAICNLYGIGWGGGSAGFWAALDPATGNILWQTADPNGGVDPGPLAVANGVVYAGSMAANFFMPASNTAPTMMALNASNGSILWTYVSGASVNSGATIVNNMVYWGSGYTHLGIPGFTGNNKLFAFSPNGK